jgi:hypothetical protein
MRKLIVLIVLIVLGAAAALPANALAFPALARSGCGSGCAAFQTSNGHGTLRASATGSAYGSVGSGSIWVLDRTSDGNRGWSVYGYERGPIRHSGGWREFRGVGMTFSMRNAWSLKIPSSSGIGVRIVANGNVTITGSGLYSINGSTWRTWPSLGRFFAL